ncbi:hypothetical protein LguiB_028786 [Lonicera macranthoides]
MGLIGFIISSSLFLSFAYVLTLFRRRKLPPGPIGLPIVGNLFDIGPKPHESLAKLAEKHGPLMTICLGSITNVVASSTEMARKILQKNDEACSGRFVPDAVTALHDYSLAVVWMSTGQRWRMIRRALNIYLTNRQKLDTLGELRHKAVHEMVVHLKLASKRKEAVDIGELTFTTALNQMSNTLVSKNVAGFDSQADGVKGFLNAVKTIMVVAGKFNIADIFPVLKPLDPQNIRRKAKCPTKRKNRRSCDPRITLLASSYKRDNASASSCAFTHTSQNREECETKGYLIPNNTRVLVNAWAIARDPKYWDNPTCFMPERFLGSELDFKGKHFEFLPFSFGRRICPGIPLAQRMVSLMVASLVYHFDWKIPCGNEKLDMNDIFVDIQSIASSSSKLRGGNNMEAVDLVDWICVAALPILHHLVKVIDVARLREMQMDAWEITRADPSGQNFLDAAHISVYSADKGGSSMIEAATALHFASRRKLVV